jgi:hypothetical protein
MFSGCGGMDIGFCGGFSFLGDGMKNTRFGSSGLMMLTRQHAGLIDAI